MLSSAKVLKMVALVVDLTEVPLYGHLLLVVSAIFRVTVSDDNCLLHQFHMLQVLQEFVW